MINSALSIFDFDIMDLFLFLFGIGVGIFLACLGYIIVVLSTMNHKNYIVQSKTEGLTTEEVEEKIKHAQAVFKDKELLGELKLFVHLNPRAECDQCCRTTVVINDTASQ